jgi:hypothetical protein
VEVAVRLLRGAALSGAKGVNILLHGPVGTGKTRLAATIAARAGLALHAVGEADEEGDEPSRTERASALRLALALTPTGATRRCCSTRARPAGGGAAAVGGARGPLQGVAQPRAGGQPTPVLWTINDLHRVDRATLRRMSLLVEVGVPEEAAVRERFWGRVLGLERLALGRGGRAAGRALGRGARALRLGGARGAAVGRGRGRGGGGDARLRPGARRRRPKAGHGGDPAAAPDLDLLACDADIPALAARLAAPARRRAGRCWSPAPRAPGARRSPRPRRRRGPAVVRRRAPTSRGPVRGSGRAVAFAFAEARAKQVALLLDGIDGVAAERGAQGADGAALDALLAEMDGHPLPVVCVADLPRRLDRAVLRRFALTVRLGGLDPERAALAFRRMLGAEPPGPLPEGLTPGDFATVRLRRALLGGDADAAALCAWLAERAEAGCAAPRDVGFRVVAPGAGLRSDRARGAG